MTCLALEKVTYRDALKDVSFTVGAGEMVAIFAPRKTDRAGLLNVAGGVEAPSMGTVIREGRFVFAQRSWPTIGGRSVIGQLMLPLLAYRPVSHARTVALKALSDWGLEDWSARQLDEMEDHELARLSLIRAVASEPDVLLVDDPTAGYGYRSAEHARRILGTARDRGAAVLLAASDLEPTVGADQIFTLSEGVIRGSRSETAEIVEFPSKAPV